VQLLEAFYGIRYEWQNNIKKSVLWEDFLEHLENYIAIGDTMFELSEKGKLYIENQRMIIDLTGSYREDGEALIAYIEARIKESFKSERWDFNFSGGGRSWQAFYKPEWKMPDLFAHFEYFFSRDVLLQESFVFALEVHGKKKDLFFELFDNIHDQLKYVYNQTGIDHRPQFRSDAVAWKRYALDKEIDNIPEQIIQAKDDLYFLIPYVDHLVNEINVLQEAGG
jgi:hypothetical protein